MKLLSIDTNAKTSKNTKYGYLTGIQYLSPYNTSGVNLCPMAEKAGCIKSCLYYSGRGKFKNVQQARLNRTKLYLTNQPEYFNQLITEIQALIKKAAKRELSPLIRLNGTSDIRWENIGFTFEDTYYRNIFEFFPNVQFMDYTKIPNRVDSKNGLNNWPSNYDLTFSYSGAPAFKKYNQRAIDKGVRIAVVFDKVETIPLQFHGRKVLGGDDNDLTFTKPKGSILALYAKGAKAEIQAGIDTQFILTKGA
tara:strand:- start:1608 stop:2357 length:750 start_codon:yes stop_codon:yes gene_type:complete